MHGPEEVYCRRLRPPAPVPPSHSAHVPATIRPSPGCHTHSGGGRRVRKRFLCLPCFLLLTACLYLNSEALLGSAGESPVEAVVEQPTPAEAVVEQPTPAEAVVELPTLPLRDAKAEEEFRVWKALTHLLRSVSNETVLAYARARSKGEALVKSAEERTRPAREKAKVIGGRAYAKLREKSAALAAAAREAARKAREAAIQAKESVKTLPGKVWGTTAKGVQRVGVSKSEPESEEEVRIEYGYD